jgi:hypothetical protein
LLRFHRLLGLPSVIAGTRAEIDEATMGFGGIGHGENNAILRGEVSGRCADQRIKFRRLQRQSGHPS